MSSATRFANGVVGILIVAIAMPAKADTVYVNGSCGNDAWTGTSSVCSAPDGPGLTIQVRINASANGDTVVVADGTYLAVDKRGSGFPRARRVRLPHCTAD